MGKNKRKGGDAQGAGGKKAKTDIHKVGKYLPGGFPIDPKMKGVLVTCTRGKEHSAGQEACDLLAEVKTNNPQRGKDKSKSLQDLQTGFWNVHGYHGRALREPNAVWIRRLFEVAFVALDQDMGFFNQSRGSDIQLNSQEDSTRLITTPA